MGEGRAPARPREGGRADARERVPPAWPVNSRGGCEAGGTRGTRDPTAAARSVSIKQSNNQTIKTVPSCEAIRQANERHRSSCPAKRALVSGVRVRPEGPKGRGNALRARSDARGDPAFQGRRPPTDAHASVRGSRRRRQTPGALSAQTSRNWEYSSRLRARARIVIYYYIIGFPRGKPI